MRVTGRGSPLPRRTCAPAKNPSLKLTDDLPLNEHTGHVFLSRRAIAGGKLLSEPDSSLGCRSRVVYLNN